jgi:hypothetical protein
MRRQCAALCAAVAIFVFALPAPGQLQLITIEHPFDAPNLSGVVVDASGVPISGVIVEECDASFTSLPGHDPAGKSAPPYMLWDCDRNSRHVTASTKTDTNGHFSFPGTRKAKVHYLHLSLDGFDPMQVMVKLNRSARSELRIQMHIAT